MFSVLSHLVFLGTEFVHLSIADQSSSNAQPSSKLHNISSISAIKHNNLATKADVNV